MTAADHHRRQRAKAGRDFIAKARAKFGTVHDYSKVTYVNGNSPVEIACAIHGHFRRKPTKYLESSHGCPDCSRAAYLATVVRRTPEQKAAQQLAYQRRNRALYNESSRKHYEAHKGTPLRRCKQLCRNMVGRTVASVKGGRRERTCALLGYSVAEFRAHIEAQFESWMTWENHGQWHVDHIVPISFYLKQAITDPAVINALSNLRPLAAHANLRKKDRCAGRTAAPLPTSAQSAAYVMKSARYCGGVPPPGAV
jgi:5-methylcytosine-specific restriction endonuclease McrA